MVGYPGDRQSMNTQSLVTLVCALRPLSTRILANVLPKAAVMGAQTQFAWHGVIKGQLYALGSQFPTRDWGGKLL